MERIGPGKMAITKVTLRPRIVFGGPEPEGATLDELHHKAHEACFIANSVTTKIAIEPSNSANKGS
jgi:organic hydroperoxide reductase OsmC/OhrA